MHQYLFYIGDFPIRAYGLLLSLGIFCAAAVAYYLFKRDGRDWHVHMFDFAITTGIAGIVGARLWDVFFFDWEYYQHHILEIPFVWQGGMAIQGRKRRHPETPAGTAPDHGGNKESGHP